MDAAANGGGGGLQRSEISFRRTGSSGLVWDDKFLGELAKIKPASQDLEVVDPSTTSDDPPRSSSAASSDPPPALLQRSRSHAGGGEAAEREKQAGYKTMKLPSPSIDPPSPKMSGCGGLCSVFGEQKQRGKVVGKRRV